MPLPYDATFYVGQAPVQRMYRGNGIVWQRPPTDRSTLVVGVDKPDRYNTGVLPGVPLTVTYNHVPASDTTYRNLEIRGGVNMAGKANVTYINCWFRGWPENPTATTSLVRLFGPHGRGHVFTDCTFQPQVPHYNWNGIQGYGFTVRRCTFLDGTDGIQVYNNQDGPAGAGDNSLRNGPADVTIEQCYFHDNGWWNSTIDVGGGPIGSHSDDIQVEGGSGVTIRGNTLTGMIGQQYGPNSYGTWHENAAVIIKPDVGLITGLVMEKNWIDGGSFSINVANDAPNRILGNVGAIRGNRFGRSQRTQGSTPDRSYTLSMPSNVTGDFTGNVYDDTNTPILVRHNG